MQVGVLGGTGPAGRGLSVRLAAAGVEVIIGSREGPRASAVAADLMAAVNACSAEGFGAITGDDNAGAAGADLVVVATPWDSAVGTVRPLAELLEGKVVISMANALVKQGREMAAMIPPRGSVAVAVQAELPASLVAAAFHHLPAAQMADLDSGLTADVLVCSDQPVASAATADLIDRMPGLRALDAGSLAQAAAIEAFTAVLITLNIRHRAHSTLKLSGI